MTRAGAGWFLKQPNVADCDRCGGPAGTGIGYRVQMPSMAWVNLCIGCHRMFDLLARQQKLIDSIGYIGYLFAVENLQEMARASSSIGRAADSSIDKHVNLES